MHREIARALDAVLTPGSAGQRCFPCLTDKRPSTPHGLKDAAIGGHEIRELWAQYPAPYELFDGDAT